MAKQLHVRLDDAVYEALTGCNTNENSSLQDVVSSAIMQYINNQNKEEIPENANFTFIDLFAGIGGMRLAYESAGGHCVYSSEWNKYSQQTYFANFGEQPEGDITKVDENEIPDHDILVAGFPCQPFSIAGVSKKQSMGRATGFEDKTQGTLFFDVCRILKAKRPKAFMLENVKNLCSHDRGRTFRVIRESLDELDYEVFYQVIDGQAFVPQHRERIIIVGFDRKRYGSDIGFSFDIKKIDPKPVMKDILETEVDSKYTLSDKLWTYLQGYAAKHKAAGNGFGYGIADPDGISRTLSARYYKDGSEILIAQKGKNPRRLTPRECARLQGFPDTFKITVSDTQAYRQFGNSVVVPLMSNVAQLICSKISELDAAAEHNNVSVKAEKLMAVGVDGDIPEINAKKKIQAVV
ncbi:MAG: DNA (cytosine-5-)-methyltransferase [Butyrivibrio sp.]|uniref:DNA (cytosine-5-)-methyltransferase n=1 Tax=Butyrivibrio sp. TaxID=28121 RepID=UPI001B1A1E3B|nr:DNA (cytosine-5-)-methyltransferase [Butyrivibrio sp.]MBO6240624.1 DNA (cytosine-5-)-methyltransferase [Butyrivibrio sp.]